MRRMLFLTLGLLAGVTALAFVQPAEAGPFKHRSGGCGECSGTSGGGFHLFHRNAGGGCTGYSGGMGCCGSTVSTGCSGGYGGCMGQTAGCSSCGGQQLQAVPCPSCPGGVRYQAAWSGEVYNGGTGVAQQQQFAVPDGQGGYRIVNASGFHNGLPIVNPNDQGNAAVQQLPAPKAMPNK